MFQICWRSAVFLLLYTYIHTILLFIFAKLLSESTFRNTSVVFFVGKKDCLWTRWRKRTQNQDLNQDSFSTCEILFKSYTVLCVEWKRLQTKWIFAKRCKTTAVVYHYFRAYAVLLSLFVENSVLWWCRCHSYLTESDFLICHCVSDEIHSHSLLEALADSWQLEGLSGDEQKSIAPIIFIRVKSSLLIYCDTSNIMNKCIKHTIISRWSS